MPRRGKNEYNTYTAKEFFALKHDGLVWDMCKRITLEKYPTYEEDYNWFENQNKGYCYNMFISKKEILDGYCEWLFDILFQLEKFVDLNKYDDYNKRMFGFLAERLINIWVHHNHLKVKEMPIYFTDGPSLWKKALQKLKL